MAAGGWPPLRALSPRRRADGAPPIASATVGDVGVPRRRPRSRRDGPTEGGGDGGIPSRPLSPPPRPRVPRAPGGIQETEQKNLWEGAGLSRQAVRRPPAATDATARWVGVGVTPIGRQAPSTGRWRRSRFYIEYEAGWIRSIGRLREKRAATGAVTDPSRPSLHASLYTLTILDATAVPQQSGNRYAAGITITTATPTATTPSPTPTPLSHGAPHASLLTTPKVGSGAYADTTL